MVRRLRFASEAEFDAWIHRSKKVPRGTLQRGCPSEEQEQILLFDWICLQEKQIPELRQLYAIPNGGYRNQREAVRLVRAGIRAGVPDLHMPIARQGAHSLYLEMKALDGHPSELQIERAILLAEAGNIVAFTWGWEMGRDILLWYLQKGKKNEHSSWPRP